jgi:hypothetical protein
VEELRLGSPILVEMVAGLLVGQTTAHVQSIHMTEVELPMAVVIVPQRGLLMVPKLQHMEAAIAGVQRHQPIKAVRLLALLMTGVLVQRVEVGVGKVPTTLLLQELTYRLLLLRP